MTKNRVALVFGAIVLLMVSLAFFRAFRGRKILVASDTTYLTSPLADDGLPDYNSWIINELMDGVTPESNAAIPLWTAMGCSEVADDQRHMLFAVLQMEMPSAEPGKFVALGGKLSDTLRDELARAQVAAEDPAETDDGSTADTEATDEGPAGEEPADAYGMDEYGMGMMAGGGPTGPIAADIIDDASNQPWKRDEAPTIAKWIDEHAAEYELLHEAAVRPKFASPSPTLLATKNQSLVYCTLPHQQMLRSAIHNLRLRAMLRIGESQYEKAWDDCRAMLAIANHIPPDSLIGLLVRIASRQLGMNTTTYLLQQPLPPELIDEIEATIAKVPKLPPLEACIDRYERLFFITTCISLSGNRGVPDGGADLPAFLRTSLAVDWNEVLRRGNSAYDAIVAALAEPDWKKRQTAIQEFGVDFGLRNRPMLRQLITRYGRTEVASAITMSMLFPVIEPLTSAHDRDRTMLDLLKISVALARFRAENGDYPKTLTEVDAPAVLLKDFRHGLTHAYQRVEGGYLLYSLGPNGQDDDGSQNRLNVYRGIGQEMLHALPDSEAPAATAGDPDWRLTWSPDSVKDADDEAIRIPVPTRESLGKR